MISGKNLALVLRKRVPASQKAQPPPPSPSDALVFCFTFLWDKTPPLEQVGGNAPFLLHEALMILRNCEESSGI